MKTCSSFLILVALGLVVGSAPAATIYWSDGGGDDLWTNTANWDLNSTGTGGNPASVGAADAARFNSLGTGDVDTTGYTAPASISFEPGSDGINLIGSGTFTGPWSYNTAGSNTLGIEVTASNNFAVQGGGTLTIADGGRLTRQDTMEMRGATVTVQSGGQFGGLQSSNVTANRLRINGGTNNVVNIEAGGLFGLRNTLSMDGGDSNVTTINNSGTMTVLRIDYNNNNKRLVIDDGAVTTVTQATTGLNKIGGDGTIDLWTQNATLALRGGTAGIGTLSEFYALTTGFSGDDFRYWDGSQWVLFDNMPGTDWFTLTYDSDWQGSGNGYTVIQTVPEPTSVVLVLSGLAGLLGLQRRRWSGTAG